MFFKQFLLPNDIDCKVILKSVRIHLFEKIESPQGNIVET